MSVFFNKQQRLRIIWRLLFFIVLTFALNIPLQLLLQKFLSEGLLRGYLSGSVFLLSMLASLYMQTRLIEKTSFIKYGLLPRGPWLKEFLFGCGITAVQLMVFYGIMYVSGNLAIESYFWIPPDADYSFSAGFFSELFGQFVGSIGEEVFFRAFLFYLFLESARHLRKAPLIKALFASLLTSVLFGLAHYSNDSATWLSTVNLTIDGLMLSIPILMTGRLGMSIGMHFSWNVMLGAVIGAGVSGNLAKVSVLRIIMPDNLFTGGAFGPEGSVLVILLDSLAVGIMLLWWKSEKQKSLLSPMVLEVGSDASRSFGEGNAQPGFQRAG